MYSFAASCWQIVTPSIYRLEWDPTCRMKAGYRDSLLCVSSLMESYIIICLFTPPIVTWSIRNYVGNRRVATWIFCGLERVKSRNPIAPPARTFIASKSKKVSAVNHNQAERQYKTSNLNHQYLMCIKCKYVISASRSLIFWCRRFWPQVSLEKNHENCPEASVNRLVEITPILKLWQPPNKRSNRTETSLEGHAV